MSAIKYCPSWHKANPLNQIRSQPRNKRMTYWQNNLLHFSQIKQLSPRELQVLRLYTQNNNTSEIASQLGISSNTVFSYIHRVSEKIGTKNRSEIIRLCKKIRHFIKSIKELCYDMNRSLPKKLSLCIAFPLFLLYSLELISGYYHQFTVFSIVFICIELCSIVLFIQFPYTGSIIIIILWITAVSIKPVLPYSFVFAGLSATVILGYINIPSAISILLFATSILFFQPHTDKSALVMFDTTFLTLAIIGCAIRLHQNQKRAINQLTIHKWKEEIAEELHDIVCNDLTYAIHQINLLKNENPNSQRNPEIAENMALLDIRDSLIEALSCSRTAITTLRKDDGSCSTSEIDITTINIIELLEQERMKLAKAGFDGIIAADGSDNLTTATWQKHYHQATHQRNLRQYTQTCGSLTWLCHHCVCQRQHITYQRQRYASFKEQHLKASARQCHQQSIWQWHRHTLISNTTRGIRRRIIRLRLR